MTDPDDETGKAATGPASSTRVNPYVGPRAFQYGETMYGRSQEIAELSDLLIARRIVLFYSPSGAGKSSLIEAGLRAELAARDFRLFPTIRVGAEPPAELDGATIRNRYVLSSVLSLEEGRARDRQLPYDQLASIDLASYVEQLVADEDAPSDPCLIFDQFEELFTLDPTDVDAKHEFLTELGIALRDRGRWALFAMREDFIAQLDPYLHLIPTRFVSRCRLDLLAPEAARLAARRPAADLGVAFTEDAADRLVGDLRRVRVQRGAVAAYELGPTVEPVQLQVVCRQLWAGLDGAASSITLDDVVALGNVDDALADFYVDQIVDVAARTGVSEREIRTWFDEKLISPDGFRTQVLEGPGDAGPAVVRELENAHLIRADRRRGTEWYELSHDRLVAPILASNARWREEHLNPLQREAQIWDARSRPTGLLITGEVLTEAEEWAQAHDDQLLPVDREYLAASRAEQRRVDLERKVNRRNRALTAIAIGVTVLALGLFLYTNNQRASAARARDRAKQALAEQLKAENERQLAEQAQAELNASNAWLAAGTKAPTSRLQLLSWLEAFQHNPAGTSADMLRKLLTAEHYLAHDPVYVAQVRALDPTGAKVAVARDGGRVLVVDVSTLQPQAEFATGDTGSVGALTFGGTGDVLAVATRGSVSLWEGTTKVGELTSPDLGAGSSITNLSVAAGANGVVAAVADPGPDGYGRPVVWDGGAPVSPPGGTDVGVARVVVAGDRLAAVVKDPADPAAGTLHVWQRTGAAWEEEQLVAPGDKVPAVRWYNPIAFSPDGRFLAAGTVLGLKVYSNLGPNDSPPQLPDSGVSIAGVAFLAAGGDAIRAIGVSGQVVDWRLGPGDQWVSSPGATLPASALVQVDRDGGRTLFGDDQSFTVADATTGDRFLGQYAVSRGSTRQGRTVALQHSGAVDEQAAPQGPWSRGAASGAFAVGLSPDGHRLARLVTPTGNAQVSSSDGTSVDRPMCADVVDAAQVATRRDVDADPAAVSVADDGVVVATVDLPAGAGGVTARSSWCRLPPDREPYGLASLQGERYRVVGVSADGRHFAIGTDLNGGGNADLRDAGGTPVANVTMAGPVTAVAVTSGDAPLVAAGDALGNVVAFEPGSTQPRCRVSVPSTEPIAAISVSVGSDRTSLVAAATRKSLFVYRIPGGPSECELMSGLDLLRDEGEVIDLSMDDDGAVTMLESDFNVTTFDPFAAPATVAARAAQLWDARSWPLTSEECTTLPATSRCP